MFNNKKDPLVDSVKTVMAENAKRRDAESRVNEAFGVTSKRGLPHEMHASYDAALEKATKTALSEGVEALDEGKISDAAKSLGKKIAVSTYKRRKFVAAQNEPGDSADQHAKRIGHIKSLAKEETETEIEAAPQIKESFERYLRNKFLKD